MPEVTANGVRLNVHRLPAPEEAAPVVVFVHGLVMDNLSSFYYTLAGPVAAAGAEVILYDMRGHGRSERTASGYTARDAVADLDALLDALGVSQPVYLAGNSFGGTVALWMALARPERVAGLVLIEALGAGDGPGHDVGQWLEEMANTLTLAAIGLDHRPVADQLARIGERKLARLARSADALLNGTTLIDDLAATPPLRAEQLRSITCPVLAVYGEHSDMIGAARGIGRHVPGCTLEILPHLAHTVLRDATGTLRELVVRWLKTQADAAADLTGDRDNGGAGHGAMTAQRGLR